jgi:alpha-beta hydrolase superfamily lysophospholipase
MKREDVAFYSEGSRLSGHLYLPDDRKDGERRPAVVLAHGFTGVKELILPDYAERFAAQGWVALTFDYRGFGTSEGQRGRLLALEQVEDIRNAVTYVRTRSEADPERIGLWGTSYGCGLVVYAAAFDDRVKAVVAQIGIADGMTSATRALNPQQVEALRMGIEQDRKQRVLTGRGMYVDPFAIIPDPEMIAFFERHLATMPHLKTHILLQYVEAHIEFSPISVVDRIAPRALLIIAAEHDAICPADELKRMCERAGEPKKFALMEGVTHFQCYEGEGMERTCREAIEWYRAHL